MKRSMITTAICLLLVTAMLFSSCEDPAKEHMIKGNGYFGQSQWDEAITEYSKAIELNPRLVEAYENRGMAYENGKDPDKAIIDYTKVVELDPSNAFNYVRRALVYYYAKQKYQETIVDCSAAIDLYSKLPSSAYNIRDFSAAYHVRGLGREGMQDWNNAIADYTKAIELNANYTEAYLERGYTYLE